MSDDNGYQDAFRDLGNIIIAAALQCDVGMLRHPFIQAIKLQAIKRGQENERLLVQLSQLSSLPIEEVIEKVQSHP